MCIHAKSYRSNDRFFECQLKAIANLGIFVLAVPAELKPSDFPSSGDQPGHDGDFEQALATHGPRLL